MSMADLSIRRPVFAWMLMLGLIAFGVIGFSRLGVSQLPDVDFPVLSVQVNWEGAAPEVVESEIVDRIEESVITVEGIREITSSIRQGRATLNIEFDIARNVDAALQEVQSAVSRVRLPLDVELPTIRKNNPEDQPIIWVGISSETRPLRELINFVDLKIKDQFQILAGVGEVILGGFADRNLRVRLDNEKLKHFELSVIDVRDALARGHLESAAGIIQNSSQEINLRIMGEGRSAQEVGELLISSRGGRPIIGREIRLKEVANIQDGLADLRRVSRVNGVPGVGLGIKKQRGSNAVKVGELVRQRISEIARTLPQDIHIGVNFDSTIFVKEAVEESEFTLVLSALVTGVVCWLFLGSLRPTINILLSIPTSIIGSFLVIYFMGFTLNLFTLLGLALAVGIVVDDAIMVLENIYRHKAMGKGRVDASRDGANEITFAAVASTVAVVAIFLPVVFMQGVIGKFFFQFGVTITTAVLLSLLEAVTLIPMRCSQFLEEQKELGRFAIFVNRSFARVAALYAALLKIFLKFRWITLLLSIAVFGASLKIVPLLRKELIPPQDQGNFIARIETPVGSSLEHTSEVMRKAESYFRALPEVRRVFLAVGGFGGGEVNTGIIFVTLIPRHERGKAQAQIMQLARSKLAEIGGFRAFIQDLSTRGFTSQRGFPLELNIRGEDWSVLDEKSRQIVKRLEQSGLVVDLNTDYRLGQPEARVWPLREEAQRRGVSVQAITETVSAAIGGIREGKFSQDGRRYDLRLSLRDDQRDLSEHILALQVRNIHGELVPIKEVIRLEQVPTLQLITRRNRERSISIYANIAPGESQAEVLEYAQKIADEILPDGYRAFFGEGAQSFKESFQSLMQVLWLGVLVAYMVLASQFNSFIHPLVVLLSMPFSVTGAFAALWLADQSLNLYSMIGLILLMGIVKKNAILLVEFTNHKRSAEGLSIDEAILQASPLRLRPILMTSLSTIAAAIPPALALGPGAESRIPMAVAVLGGMVVSTVFTLFVVPCAYRIMCARR